jgi:hypothetical protein
MDMKRFLFYSFCFMIVFNLVGWFYSESVACNQKIPGCMGGTTYNGFPLKWYEWGAGDVFYGDEWLKGTINWLNLIVDLAVWLFVGLAISFIILKTGKK